MEAVQEIKMMTVQELLTEYNAREVAGRTELFAKRKELEKSLENHRQHKRLDSRPRNLTLSDA
jgi:hypothetical protein